MNPIASIDIPLMVIPLRNGDENAISSLFHQFGRKIYVADRRMFLPDAAAEEMVQQQFFKIIKKKEQLKDESPQAHLAPIMLGPILANHPSMPPPGYN
ncbi:RNA polymerase sigma factor [Lunatibacter salilacus]|uniref:hypothetical protein n=1 Tax=Lunatibacter salilacus TaxID=2483804 RepID=UPI00131C4E7E|nr:hypothetical protein [Lunatibacter salilacus]